MIQEFFKIITEGEGSTYDTVNLGQQGKFSRRIMVGGQRTNRFFKKGQVLAPGEILARTGENTPRDTALPPSKNGFWQMAGGKPLTQMTLKEVRDMQKSGQLNAVGRYQVINTTMSDIMKDPNLNLDPNALFDETMQDQIGMWLMLKHAGGGLTELQKRRQGSPQTASGRGTILRWLRGDPNITVEQAADAAAAEWASVSMVRGQMKSAYANNTATISRDAIMDWLKKARKRFSPPPPPAAPTTGAPTAGMSLHQGSVLHASLMNSGRFGGGAPIIINKQGDVNAPQTHIHGGSSLRPLPATRNNNTVGQLVG